MRCALDYSLCGTGLSSYPPGQHLWFCGQDIIQGALPSGSGKLCYESAELCQVGLNSCGYGKTHCVQDYALCPTGVAGSAATPHSWICEADYPPGALSNGFGAWCVRCPRTACAVSCLVLLDALGWLSAAC